MTTGNLKTILFHTDHNFDTFFGSHDHDQFIEITHEIYILFYLYVKQILDYIQYTEMENKKNAEYWLKFFNVKSCAVKLERMEFKKIRMQCTATCSEDDLKLKCHMVQKESNTFRLTIKRVPFTSNNDDVKGVKFSKNIETVLETPNKGK